MLTMLRWIALVSAIVFVLALAGVVISSQNTAPPSDQPTAEKSQQENKTEKSNISLFDRWFPDSTAFFNLFLVIFTGILAFGGIYQLKILTRAEVTSAESAKAAKDAADATRDAVNLSRENSIKQLRAYIFLDKDVVDGDSLKFAVGEVPTGIFRFNNFGVTPANDLIVYISSGIGPWPMSNETKLPLPPPMKGTQVAPPGAITLWPLEPRGQPVKADDFEQARAGKLRFYVWGRATYSDVFGNDRFTNFCLAIVPPTDPRSGGGYGFVRCPIHNDYN